LAAAMWGLKFYIGSVTFVCFGWLLFIIGLVTVLFLVLLALTYLFFHTYNQRYTSTGSKTGFNSFWIELKKR
jgi:hypothetical protein